MFRANATVARNRVSEQTLVYGLVVAGLYTVTQALGCRRTRHRYLVALILLGVGLAVGAVQLLPTLELLGQSMRARTDYEFFLSAGLAAATAIQILMISGGALGLLPLSGVVTPFLSYGRSSMLANFAVIGILLAISSRRAPDDSRAVAFVGPTRFAAGLIVIMSEIKSHVTKPLRRFEQIINVLNRRTHHR